MPNFFGVGKKDKKSDDCRVLLVGHASVGKTSFLYKLKLGEVVTTIPTLGFNVETFSPPPHHQRSSVSLTMWDVGGQERIRPLWRHYVDESRILCFMVDASKPDEFANGAADFAGLLPVFAESSRPGVDIAILVNKMDLLATDDERSRVLDAAHRAFKVDDLTDAYTNVAVIGISAVGGDFEEFWTFIGRCVAKPTKQRGGPNTNNNTAAAAADADS